MQYVSRLLTPYDDDRRIVSSAGEPKAVSAQRKLETAECAPLSRRPQAASTVFRSPWHPRPCFTHRNERIANERLRIEKNALLFRVDFRNGQLRGNGVADMHRFEEIDLLAHVGASRPRQPCAEERGPQAGGQHAMYDSLIESRAFSELGVQVQGVGISGDGGEHQDIGVSDRLCEYGVHADREVFQVVTMLPFKDGVVHFRFLCG